MRKLIVSNFLTLDGLYEGKDKNINSLYDYYHKDYHGDDTFDFYNAELVRASDFLLLSRSPLRKLLFLIISLPMNCHPGKTRASSSGQMPTKTLPRSNSNLAETSWCY